MKRWGIAFGIVVLSFTSLTARATLTNEQAKSEVEKTALQFFIDQAHPATGLVRDQAENFVDTPDTNRTASMAATGFGLVVITNAALRGMVTMEFARDYALKVLRFSRDHVDRRKGWFLHWVDWEIGERSWDSEYSTIDSALFLAGALYAAQVFPNSEVSQIANELYEETDFYDAMTDGGALPDKRTLSMAFYEGQGYTRAQWDMYAEQMVLLMLGMGHPTHPLPPEVWLNWERKPVDVAGAKNVMGMKEALFIQQYSQVFIDFRNFKDSYPNYHENGKTLTRIHRNMALPSATQSYQTLQKGFWGYSAGYSPGEKYRVNSALDHESTVCIGCVAASAMYMPNEILSDMAGWIEGPYASQLWGRYGFCDSIDIDQDWFAHQVLGITVGPEYMALANLDEDHSIWKTFMEIPAIKRGMSAATAIAKPYQTLRKPVSPQNALIF